ncbi:MAG: hypothetical protein HGA36_03175 [Candidatus Moranbacteria bacterium]|nr:hypothetical protein [Candidatus Moranbacteria bacterium]
MKIYACFDCKENEDGIINIIGCGQNVLSNECLSCGVKKRKVCPQKMPDQEIEIDAKHRCEKCNELRYCW